MSAVAREKAACELVAPKVGGVTGPDGSWFEAHHLIDGGPSVLFDAVALLTSAEAIDDLVNEATARDFVADAFQHCKFIGCDQWRCPCWEKPALPTLLLRVPSPSPASYRTSPSCVSRVGNLR